MTAFNLSQAAFRLLGFFYLAAVLTFLYLLKKKFDKKYGLDYQIQILEEKLNLLHEEHTAELKNNAALKLKIVRYDRLKKCVEEVNESLDLDKVTDALTEIAFSAISHDKGVCILHLVDSRTQKLHLYKTKKEDANITVKAKEGDIFDIWVLRHASPLLIAEIRNDFRFDPEKLKKLDVRDFSSLISAPFSSEDKFLGLLRIDNPKPNFYSQDDLRLMATICDLGSIALENSLLFKETQELAVHDGLTGLFTKGYFLERLNEECSRNLIRNESFSLFMLDIDYFKKYNDKFGHTAGDILLRRLSRKITDLLKDLNPIAGRFGGEEFCVILPNLGKKEALAEAKKLCKNIEEEKITLRRIHTNITVSIGVATFPKDGSEATSLISNADKALYEAKQKGRNRVCSL